MNQQVTFTSSPSATVPGQWIGQVIDKASKRVLTRTSMTYPTSDEARFGARIKWLGRGAQMALAAGMVGGCGMNVRPIDHYIQLQLEADRAARIHAELTVAEVIARFRRTDAAPDDDDLQTWHDASPFLISMVIGLWIAVGVTVWRFL